MKKLFILFAIFTLALVSCEKEPMLTVSVEQISVPSSGISTSVVVNANNPWTVSGNDWCTVTPSSGDGGVVSVTVTVNENTTYDSRNCTLVFTSEGLMASVSVIQGQKDALIIGKKEYEVKSKGDTIEVVLSSNVDFGISIEESWIKQIDGQSTRALSEHKLFFQVEGNEQDQGRSSRITFTNKANGLAESITIKQRSYEEEIPYLTFAAASGQTLAMTKAVETLEYSVNGGEWVELGTNTVSFGGEYGNLRLRGKNPKGTASSNSDYARIKFGNEAGVSCSGDIRTLVDYKNYAAANTENARFCGLFKGCTSLITAPELPALTLADYCYYCMFQQCTSLITAPELPATTLADHCYYYMFGQCSNLTTAPELPAITLADDCYNCMFQQCTSLTTAPELPATTLAESCYCYMFSLCTGLTTAPELPATTMADYCYYSMFNGCTGLTIAPALPAKALAYSCYGSMFRDCYSLTVAPELPALTLADHCYASMFRNCTGLVTAPELPATTLADYCYYYMFNKCSSLTTAPKLPAATLTNNCYYAMFEYCTSLTVAPELPATTLAASCYSYMFRGCTGLTTAPDLRAEKLVKACYLRMFWQCSSLNSVTMTATDISASSCLYYWLKDVSKTGKFKKDASTDIPSGPSGIPEGWEVILKTID